MLKDNRNYNAQVTSNTAFLKTLRDKLPEFFTADKIDGDGVVTSQGTFDFEKFKKALAENSIQTELTSGYQLKFIGKDYAKKQAGEAPTTVVLPDKVHNEQTENQNSQNLFFTGDNLEVLRHLQAGYENSIDVIYIDIKLGKTIQLNEGCLAYVWAILKLTEVRLFLFRGGIT